MRSLATLLLAGAAACAPPPTEPPRWSVRDGFVRDAQGRAVVMRGLNLSGVHKSKPYFGEHGAADYARVRDAWGMNAIRFLVLWAALEPQPGRYDEAYLDEVARRIEWAREARLLVVLDMHQDVFGEGFGGDGAPRWACDEARYAAHKPTSPWYANYASKPVMECFDLLYTDGARADRFARAWRRLAERLARYDHVVGFDVLNEPHWGSASVWSFERERLQPFYRRVVRAVREVAPDWVAFLEPAGSRNLGMATSLERFAGDAELHDAVYAPHSYDNAAESGSDFDPARRAALMTNIEALAREARDLGAALWIGEYGGVASAPGIVPYMDASYDGAAAAAASTIYWDYSRGGYGVLADDGSERKELLGTLVRPYPERVAGTLERYAFDEGTRVFSVSLRPDPALAGAATELALPARVYPEGFVVECGGCSVERLAGGARLTGVTATTVSVRPAR
jgi:endoglycosylceramidase